METAQTPVSEAPATPPGAAAAHCPGFSVYLDLVRFFAAMLVFIEHARLSGLVRGVPGLDRLAGEAVTIFFVLSGYIIASTTLPARGWRTFAVARAARIYSVVVPALVLGVVLKGGYLYAHGGTQALLAFLSDEVSPLKVAAILSFTGEIWTVRVDIPWDGPVWSLDYEVFYYLLFGVLTFMTGRARLLWAAALCLAAGPKILILLPCWGMGVLLARRTDLAFKSRALAWVVLFAGPAAIWLLNRSGIFEVLKRDLLYQIPGFWRLDDATNFAAYYLDMVFIAAAFIAARQLDFGPRSALMRCAPVIQWLAGYTFSLYLFHRPFQNLLAQFYADNPAAMPSPVWTLGVILIAVALLGAVTEKRKDIWRRVFANILGKPRAPLLPPKTVLPAG